MQELSLFPAGVLLHVWSESVCTRVCVCVSLSPRRIFACSNSCLGTLVCRGSGPILLSSSCSFPLLLFHKHLFFTAMLMTPASQWCGRGIGSRCKLVSITAAVARELSALNIHPGGRTAREKSWLVQLQFRAPSHSHLCFLMQNLMVWKETRSEECTKHPHISAPLTQRFFSRLVPEKMTKGGGQVWSRRLTKH